jgi:nicotinic acid mononucleotide adenylyltransferase
MMQRAKAAAETVGFEVIGGYLSPGHDDYLRMKCGAAAIPAYERLRLCAAAVADSDWLSVDPWEAMHRRVAVNYTDVVARLEKYLRAHVDPRVQVLYVCGGDNARFSLAFSERGGCIVVGRPGSEDEQAKWRHALGECPQILWTTSGHRQSSRDLRTAVWQAPRRPRVIVRTEDARSVRTLGLPHLAAFQTELLEQFARHVTVRSLPLGVADPQAAIISLDPMLPSVHNLAVSRLFATGGYERRGHVARPGSDPIERQIADIPDGQYSLSDDDSMTGATMAAVRAMLPSRLQISQTRLAIAHDPDEDVLDARDFLLGADHGGLVLELPNGEVGRAPYLLPYVDPAVRASIHASHDFSIEVWSLNARLFAATDLRVHHLPAPTRKLFRFPDDLRLEALCTWHADRLRTFGRQDSPDLIEGPLTSRRL